MATIGYNPAVQGEDMNAYQIANLIEGSNYEAKQFIVDSTITHLHYWKDMAVYAHANCKRLRDKYEKMVRVYQRSKPTWWNVADFSALRAAQTYAKTYQRQMNSLEQRVGEYMQAVEAIRLGDFGPALAIFENMRAELKTEARYSSGSSPYGIEAQLQMVDLLLERLREINTSVLSISS